MIMMRDANAKEQEMPSNKVVINDSMIWEVPDSLIDKVIGLVNQYGIKQPAPVPPDRADAPQIPQFRIERENVSARGRYC